MTDKHIYVTAYATPHGDLLSYHPNGALYPTVFTVNQARGVRIERRDALDAVRASGVTPHFYSIPDPF